MEGVGNKQIVEDHHGMTHDALMAHRTSGHAARDLTAKVLQAGASGVLSEIAAVQISRKAYRLEQLDYAMTIVKDALDTQRASDKGSIDAKLVAQIPILVSTAAKEMGEWRPDGGEKAESAANLARSIVIHAAAVVAAAQKDGDKPLTIDISSD